MNIVSVKKHNSIAGNLTTYIVKTTTLNIILSVPIDEDNTDYQEILKWVAEGNTIEEAD